MKKQLQAYRRADTMGKSQLELILMVYDGAIKALRMAADHYGRENNQAGYEELQRAKRMVTHLYTTLDNERGGQVAANLGKVYSWAISQMQLIEATSDSARIDAVVRALSSLRSGWAELKDGARTAAEAVQSPQDSREQRNPEHVLTTA